MIHTILGMNSRSSSNMYVLSQVWLFGDPMNCSLPGFSVHGIFQARLLEQVTISSSRGSSWPRDWIWISCVSWVSYIAVEFFITALPGKLRKHIVRISKKVKHIISLPRDNSYYYMTLLFSFTKIRFFLCPSIKNFAFFFFFDMMI